MADIARWAAAAGVAAAADLVDAEAAVAAALAVEPIAADLAAVVQSLMVGVAHLVSIGQSGLDLGTL